MLENDIAKFCDQHGACSNGREWAIQNCTDMADAWDKLKPEWLLWVAVQPGVLDDRTLRLFAVWCARHVQHLMPDERSINALDVAERFANGNATSKELAAAQAAAEDAAWDAALAAVRVAAWVAVRDAAWAAARVAARAAVRDAAWAAAWVAVRDAAWDAQAKHLREMGNPFREQSVRKADGGGE